MLQNKHCRSKGENTMKVTLKDGSVKEYSEPMSVNDIAWESASITWGAGEKSGVPMERL